MTSKSKQRIKISGTDSILLNYISLSELSKQLIGWIAKYGEDAQIIIDSYGGYDDYYGSYDSEIDVSIRYERDETDEEYTKRQEKNKKAREKAKIARENKKKKEVEALQKLEKEERLLLEKLKAKYEG